MDEIICPICGRGNTPQAVNCRYCQAALDKPEKPHTDQLFETTQNPEFIRKRPSPNTKTEEDANNEENTPEWLKRIRELKKVDEEREREKEKWRQQTLFGQSNEQKIKQKHTHSVKKPDETTKPGDEEVIPEEPTVTNTTIEPVPSPSTEDKTEESSDQVDDKEEDQDLPDGYEPFPNE